MTKLQEFCFPMQKDIQIAYGLSSEPKPNEGRYTFDVCYDLEHVFNKDYYKNGKKYKKHTGQYINYAEENGLYVKAIETAEEKAAVIRLYHEWNDAKLEADKLNPNHYTEHSARYLDCLNYTFEGKLSDKAGVVGLFNTEKQLLAYQMYTVNDCWMFGVTTAFSKKFYSHTANVATVAFLKYFKEKGMKFANWGETGGDQKLLEFKEAYPNFRIYYGKLNVTFRKSTEADTEAVVNFMKENSTEAVPFPTEYMPKSVAAGNVTMAFVDSELAGIVECRVNSKKINFMTNLITNPKYRGQGIATKLLDQLERPFSWECYMHNTVANNFYEKLEGAKQTGIVKDEKGLESYSYTRY